MYLALITSYKLWIKFNNDNNIVFRIWNIFCYLGFFSMHKLSYYSNISFFYATRNWSQPNSILSLTQEITFIPNKKFIFINYYKLKPYLHINNIYLYFRRHSSKMIKTKIQSFYMCTQKEFPYITHNIQFFYRSIISLS